MSYKYVWACYNWKQYGKISIALFVQVAFRLRKRFLPYCFQFREGYKETNFWRPKGYVSYLLTLPFLLWLKDEGHSLGTGTYTSADKHSSSLFIWRFSICIKKKIPPKMLWMNVTWTHLRSGQPDVVGGNKLMAGLGAGWAMRSFPVQPFYDYSTAISCCFLSAKALALQNTSGWVKSQLLSKNR